MREHRLLPPLSIALMTALVVGALLWWASPLSLHAWRAGGIATGWVGSGLLLVSLLLMVREPVLARWFGGLETMYRWHHILGVWAYVFLLMHPLALAASDWGESTATAWAVLSPWQESWPVWLGWASLLGLMAGLYASLSPSLRYATWRRLHHLLSAAVILGAAHLVVLGLSGVLATAPTLLIATLMWRVVRADHGLGARPYVVERVNVCSPTTVELTLQPLTASGGGGPLVKPGQFVLAAFDAGSHHTGRGEFHPYTVSEIAPDGHLALAIKALGDCTRQIQSIQVGAKARVQGPFGDFLADANARPGLWLAGGIGITPFIAALRNGPLTQALRLIYLHRDSATTAPFSDELRQLSSTQPLLHLQMVATGNAPPDLAQLLPPSEALVGVGCFICGPSALLDAASTLLQSRGVDPAQIHFERFDFR